MSDISQVSALAHESCDDLYQRACNLGVYEGAELSKLPVYVQMRLIPILWEKCNGKTLERMPLSLNVCLSSEKISVIPSRLTVIYQHGQEGLEVKEYLYEEWFKKVIIRSQTGGKKESVVFFKRLFPYFRDGARYEEGGDMASFDMIECDMRFE